ncbi:MAG: hypothetical protein Q7U87_02445 [bacterium]|nr:hypothetical protein [bacterium]
MKKTQLLLLALLSLFWCSNALADNQCAQCRKWITSKDSYIEHEGRIYCSQKCFAQAMPKCAVCGKSIASGKGLSGSYVYTKDKYYCSDDCFQKSLPFCAVCKKPTKGGLRSKEDPTKIYCSQDCYQATLPKCARCGTIMKSWTVIDGVNFCQDCKDLPACFNCQMPGAGRESKDGRRWCDTCMAQAVMDSAKAEQLFRQTREEIKAHLGLSTPDTIRFQLVDADQLGQLLGHKNFAEHGLYRYDVQYTVTRKTEGKTVRETKKVSRELFDIFILTGLSPQNFKDVAAHELAHDINYRYFPKVQGQREVEGFAEYVSALMNQHWGQAKVNDTKLRNLQKEYAEAYKYYLKLGEKRG